MLYTITIEIEAPDSNHAKNLMEAAKEGTYEALDEDKGEDLISWRVDPK